MEIVSSESSDSLDSTQTGTDQEQNLQEQDVPTVSTVDENGSRSAPASPATSVSTRKSKDKRGRKASDIWSYFTEDKGPHLLKSAICKNCKLQVTHHKKSEYAKSHLLKCVPFKKAMYGTLPEDRPEWFPSKKYVSGSVSGTVGLPLGTQSGSLSTSMVETSFGSTAGSSAGSTQSSTSFIQRSMKSFAIPLLSESEKHKLNENLAMFFYKTGTSFVRVEDEHLKKAFDICRPGTTLPSRRQLATTLLDKCYENIKKKVNESLPQNICIVSDAWTNVKGEPIVNYMGEAPNASYFLESVQTGSQAHTSQWLADDIARVIDSIAPPTIVSGAVTDNTAANKSAWRLLEEKYPKKFFHGCVCHCLNLLVKDIFGDEGKGKGSDKTPLASLAAFAAECKTIVVFFKNHHLVHNALKVAQKEKNIRGLVQPAATRWGTLFGCFKSLLESEGILHTLVHSRDFLNAPRAQRDVREEIKNSIANASFVENLNKSIFILSEIDRLTTKFQGNSVPISDVYAEFLGLPSYFESEKAYQFLKIEEANFIKSKIKDRFQFIYGDAHGVGYLLDPRYAGEGMDRGLREELEDFIMKFNNDNDHDSHKETVFRQLTDFQLWVQDQKRRNTFRYQQLLNKKKTVQEFWKLDGKDYPALQDLALQVFSMVPSSCASERNFSTFGFVHSKLRNQLSETSVQKLVYVKTNGNILFNGNDNYDSDTDYEDVS